MAEDVVSSEVPLTEDDRAERDVSTTGTVIAALDGSAADGPVVDWAADEAAWLDVPLRLVSVVDPGLQLTPYEALATGSPSLADHLEEGARHVLDRAVDRVRDRHPGLDVATAVP
jgi:nucleotide-binding universal stress UspA family protein